MLKDVPHPEGFSLRITDTPIKLSRTPGGIQGPPPIAGADTDDVLRTLLGLTGAQIAELREKAVVFGPLPSPVPRILEHEKRIS
jgi:crotonobetainyl-CoA:carnitine CoA-transferase CaiB-like acyl-CoA transferase